MFKFHCTVPSLSLYKMCAALFKGTSWWSGQCCRRSKQQFFTLHKDKHNHVSFASHMQDHGVCPLDIDPFLWPREVCPCVINSTFKWQRVGRKLLCSNIYKHKAYLARDKIASLLTAMYNASVHIFDDYICNYYPNVLVQNVLIRSLARGVCLPTLKAY